METWKFPWCHSTCRRAEQQSAAGTALLLATCTSPLLHVCVGEDCKSRTFCISVGEYVRGSCPGSTVVTALCQYNVLTRLQARSWSPDRVISSSSPRLQRRHAQCMTPATKQVSGSDSTDILDDIFSTFNMVFHKVLESALIF